MKIMSTTLNHKKLTEIFYMYDSKRVRLDAFGFYVAAEEVDSIQNYLGSVRVKMLDEHKPRQYRKNKRRIA